jgi:hypothetical protein
MRYIAKSVARMKPARAAFARMAVIVGLISGAVVLPGAPSGAAPTWSVVKSPSPAGPPIGTLSSVSCATAKSCFAVGSGETGTLVERWNGTGWALVKAPSPARDAEVDFSGVSCSSPTNCVAIGEAFTETASSFTDVNFAERWNGRTWSLIPAPATPTGMRVQLDAISCLGAKSCFAVGEKSKSSSSDDGNFEQLNFTTVVEHWNGAAWSIVSSPNPKGAFLSFLSGVSCASAKSCFAVGDYIGQTAGGSLIEHWDGRHWSVVASPHAKSSAKPRLRNRIKPGIVTSFEISGGLSGVSCPTTTSCFAVGGGFSGGALTERWNGKKWSTVASPTPPGSNGAELAAVSCATATDCSAVGTTFTGSTFDGLLAGEFGSDALSEHWDGTAWSIVAQPAAVDFGELTSVSCPTTHSCAAVGNSVFVQHWNGTHWGVAPFTSKTSQSQLVDVSCPTTACVAVGSFSDGKTTRTLTERRVGAKWKIVPSPNPAGAVSSIFSGVACITATDCTAVGTSLTIASQPQGVVQQALIEHWNGGAWTIVPSPAPSGTSIELDSVACVSATNCTAVGVALSQTSAAPLIEHWNGATWSVVPGPTPPFGFFDELASVSCASASNCMAVGYFEASTGTRNETARTLVEHWNGSSWSILPSPNLKGVQFSGLFGVSCPSKNNCSAVGVSQAASGTSAKTLSEHWNGTKWVIVPSPNPSRSIGSGLGGVSCRGTSSCYAVGSFSTITSDKTLVEHWNGKTWKIIPSPSPSPGGEGGAGLNGVSCSSRTSCTAVGSYGALDGFFTLIERGP